jgi:hypothetical protein
LGSPGNPFVPHRGCCDPKLECKVIEGGVWGSFCVPSKQLDDLKKAEINAIVGAKPMEDMPAAWNKNVTTTNGTVA